MEQYSDKVYYQRLGKQKLITEAFYQWEMVDKKISKLKLINIINY